LRPAGGLPILSAPFARNESRPMANGIFLLSFWALPTNHRVSILRFSGRDAGHGKTGAFLAVPIPDTTPIR